MLDEYALRFYALLEQSLKLDAIEWSQLAEAFALPYMDDTDRIQVMAKYQQASYDMVEALQEKPDEITDFKKALG